MSEWWSSKKVSSRESLTSISAAEGTDLRDQTEEAKNFLFLESCHKQTTPYGYTWGQMTHKVLTIEDC